MSSDSNLKPQSAREDNTGNKGAGSTQTPLNSCRAGSTSKSNVYVYKYLYKYVYVKY